MSRAYRVNWKTATGVVTCNDEVEYPLDLMGILSESEMKQLLQASLEKEGWKRMDDGSMQKEMDGAIIKLDPDCTKITASLEVTKKITVREVEGKEQQKLIKTKELEEERIKKESCDALTSLEVKLHENLQNTIQRVYVEALKQKAAQMGQIESVIETGECGEYELVIKVRT